MGMSNAVSSEFMAGYFTLHKLKKFKSEGLAEFKTTAAAKSLCAQILGTPWQPERAQSVNASISPCLARSPSSQGAANAV
jgi:hypothetical protein